MKTKLTCQRTAYTCPRTGCLRTVSGFYYGAGICGVEKCQMCRGVLSFEYPDPGQCALREKFVRVEVCKQKDVVPWGIKFQVMYR